MSLYQKLRDKTTVDEKLINAGKLIHKEYKKTLVSAINAGLAFLIALYMKDVLQDIMEFVLFKLNIADTEGIIYKTVVALIVIAICVLVIIFLGRWQEK